MTASVMQVKDVENRVADIAACVADFEVAHGMEDSLHEVVLEQIAEFSTDAWARRVAEAALRSRDIEFVRYCA